MRAFLVVLLALVTGVAGWFLGSNFGAHQSLGSKTGDAISNVSNSNTYSAGKPKTVHCQGKIEPASGLIKIVAPPGQRIEKLTDKKIGEIVNREEILVSLESQVLRMKDLELAKSRRADAILKTEFEKGQSQFKLDSAKLALAEANASDETISTEAKKIRLLHRQLDTADQLLSRLQKLQSDPKTSDLINQTDVEKQALIVEQLRLEIEQADLEIELARKSAQRSKEVAKNNLKMIEHSIENADIITPLNSFDAAIAMAKQSHEMTQIRSPINNATILDIIVREGDSVASQPVMLLADTSEMVCVAEVNDLFLHLIDPSKHQILRARITSAAFDQPLQGTVISKGIMIGPPSLRDPNPFSTVDRRTGTVTIKLDDSKLASGFVNLQVDVEIEVEPGVLGD